MTTLQVYLSNPTSQPSDSSISRFLYQINWIPVWWYIRNH